MNKIIQPEEWGYKKVLKVRVMQATFDDLVAMQKKKGICMAQLLRELIYESMEKENTDTEEITT